jgi:hypothetical protein
MVRDFHFKTDDDTASNWTTINLDSSHQSKNFVRCYVSVLPRLNLVDDISELCSVFLRNKDSWQPVQYPSALQLSMSN